MPIFVYKAAHADGTIAEGQVDAVGRLDAFRQIEAMGLQPVKLSESAAAAPTRPAASAAPHKSLLHFHSNRIPARALENFTRLLSSLLASGVPLSRALVILCREAAVPAAAAKWREIHDLVINGTSLADAMARSPDVFPRVYVAMVQAGETGGFLDVVLSQIADFQSREKELRSKVTSAMLYPCILLGLAICVLTLLLVFFIPNFQKVFRGFGGSLPLLTQVIIGASHMVRSYGLLLVAGLFVAGLLIRNSLRSERGRRLGERWALRVPVIGELVARFAMARFCRMLGTLLGAGVPLMQALGVARKSIVNQVLVDTVTSSIERVQKGGRLGESLAESGRLFPRSILEMVSVAEESGRLDDELVRIAVAAESDLDRQLKTAVAFAEPLMLFVVAAFIGTIFIGMLLPIFTLQQYIK
jgi:type II secretory pathway component PulF